jgi:hypothetical protein
VNGELSTGYPLALWPRGSLPVQRLRVENLKHVGWQLFRVETYVNGCGHGQEVSPLLLAYGRMAFVPVVGEAR